MTVRRATKQDTAEILRIFSAARNYMKKNGNGGQWGDSYPPPELVEEDIAGGFCYAVCDGEGENGRICGVFSFFPEGDSAYDIIEGAWLNDAPYGAVHRVASDGSASGVVRTAVQYCKGIRPQLKIDTGEKNISMQRALEKCGFVRCGTVVYDDGTPRIAYQLDGGRAGN